MLTGWVIAAPLELTKMKSAALIWMTGAGVMLAPPPVIVRLSVPAFDAV